MAPAHKSSFKMGQFPGGRRRARAASKHKNLPSLSLSRTFYLLLISQLRVSHRVHERIGAKCRPRSTSSTSSQQPAAPPAPALVSSTCCALLLVYCKKRLKPEPGTCGKRGYIPAFSVLYGTTTRRATKTTNNNLTTGNMTNNEPTRPKHRYFNFNYFTNQPLVSRAYWRRWRSRHPPWIRNWACQRVPTSGTG